MGTWNWELTMHLGNRTSLQAAGTGSRAVVTRHLRLCHHEGLAGAHRLRMALVHCPAAPAAALEGARHRLGVTAQRTGLGGRWPGRPPPCEHMGSLCASAVLTSCTANSFECVPPQ